MKKITRIGVGGPVGSGKTAIIEAVTPVLIRRGIKPLIITNDVVTTEDAKHVQRELDGILEAEKIVGVETGACPHTAIREDPSMNLAAVDNAIAALTEIKIPAEWAEAVDKHEAEACSCGCGCGHNHEPAYITDVVRPILAQQGDKLPVSAFEPDGLVPLGTTAYEKRGVAVNIPEWISENCIQCCQCSFVCPHAAIRPVLATEEELSCAPDTFVTKDAIGKELKGLKFRIQVYAEDCLGCGSCAEVCPAKTKALVMKPLHTQIEAQVANLKFATECVEPKDNLVARDSLKGSQLQQPLLEFSGACAGCGETPYVKLITQLFGERMLIANATGCSSIWGGSAPTVPYTTNKDGHGPAWGSSLFEDAAEYGFGMFSAVKHRREKLADIVAEAAKLPGLPEGLVDALNGWLENKEDAEGSKKFGEEILAALSDAPEHELFEQIWDMNDLLTKKSVWVFGGDGWAYDIGYGGLDHVLASGEDAETSLVTPEAVNDTVLRVSDTAHNLHGIVDYLKGRLPGEAL